MKDIEWHDSNKLAWNLITPRLEALVGLPGISEHLVVSAGLSLKLVAPLLDPGQPVNVPVPSYH